MAADLTREAEAVRALKAALAAYEDDALVNDSIEGETSFKEACAKVVEGLTGDQILLEGIAVIDKDLSARRERIKKRADARRAMLEQALAIAELPSLELPAVTLVLAKRPQQMVVDDEATIPARFWEAGDPKLDKAALKDALMAGEAIPGARLNNAPPSLTMRRR